MMRIAVVTTDRADFGLIRWIAQGIHDSSCLSLCLIAAGSHTDPRFGRTLDEIQKSGLPIASIINTQMGDGSHFDVSRAFASGHVRVGTELANQKADLVLLTGDRFEMLAAGIAATFMRVPIAHLHGGEVTLGSQDEMFRHALTKLSALHFASCEEHARRIVQMGEQPSLVHNVGAPGLDSLSYLEALSRPELSDLIGKEVSGRIILVTLHPATAMQDGGAADVRETLAALERLGDTNIIITRPNADLGRKRLEQSISDFASSNDHVTLVPSLGHDRYLSLLLSADAVVGNSSSGLIEAPAIPVASVNVGSRQQGRPRAPSVIDVEADRDAILAAIDKACSPQFQRTLSATDSPYGRGGASGRVVSILERQNPRILRDPKVFFDLAEERE